MLESLRLEMLRWYEASSHSSASSKVSSMRFLFRVEGAALTRVEMRPPKSAGASVLIPHIFVDSWTWMPITAIKNVHTGSKISLGKLKTRV